MHCFTLATPMIKYKNLCGYSLSMKTKDLTRDEAREAIGILALRKDNSENIAMSGQLIVYTLLAIAISIFITSVIALVLHSNNPTTSILSLIFIVISVVLLFASSRINRLVGNFAESNSKSIKETMEKIAKEHNLEAFLDAISYKKNKLR
jgi:Sec-independent protein translocase protein TatA